jgi:cytochrome c peroxidase
MDTRNDGSSGTFKTVLSLRNVAKTPPYFWHGWQKDLREAVRKSMIDSMLGKAPAEGDLDALLAFLDTLATPPSPHRTPAGKLSEAAARGETVFRGDIAACSHCHSGPTFTDGRIHDVGSNGRTDVYKGYNTPSLLGVYDRPLLMHDGRARSFEELLTDPHNPATVTGRGQLSPDEQRDLIEFLKSL